MMEKYALVRSEEPPIELIVPGRQVKTAGLLPAVSSFLSTLIPSTEYTYALCTAMSEGYLFGANSNADWYGYNPHLRINGLTWDPDKAGLGDTTWAGWQTDPIVHQRLAKQWKYGYPTFYGANVFAHHRNTNPALGFGDVLFAYWNESMKRVELVMRINNRVCREKGYGELLDRLHRGARVDVSMGCKIPFDLDSIETDWERVREAMARFDPALHPHPGIPVLLEHKKRKIRGLAETPAEYGGYMRTRRLEILPDGRRVFVFNDFCRFFDISLVWIGADKTSKVMAVVSGIKGAPTKRPHKDADLMVRAFQEQMAKQRAAAAKKASDKSAEMVKIIPGGHIDAVLADVESSPDMQCLDLLPGSTPPMRVLSSLAALGVVVSPTEFATVLLRGNDPALLRQLRAQGLQFDTALGGADGRFAVRKEDVDPKLLAALAPAAHGRSALDPHLGKRLRAGGAGKTAGRHTKVARSESLDSMASAYNGYRASLLTAQEDLAQVRAAAARQNPEMATLVSGLSLGIDGVLQLVASYLQRSSADTKALQVLGTLISASPLLSQLAAFGTALQAEMATNRVGGLLEATRRILPADVSTGI